MFKCLSCTTAYVLLAATASAEVIKINAIDWCPQLCADSGKPGYVMDTVKLVFEGSPYEIEAKTYPWTRAILGVYNGKSHALLSPAKNEAPKLRYPQHAIGVQRMCFFTSVDSEWYYQGLSSLKNLKIGIAYDTSIAELNDYVSLNREQFEFLPYNHEFLIRNLNMLSRKRLDTFLFTYNSTIFSLQQLNLESSYREAGCVSSEPIYMAFSPNPDQSDQIDELMRFFDRRMQTLKETGQIESIMKSYGLADWQPFIREN